MSIYTFYFEDAGMIKSSTNSSPFSGHRVLLTLVVKVFFVWVTNNCIMTLRRIKREIDDLIQDPIDGVSTIQHIQYERCPEYLLSTANPFEYQCILNGPHKTPYISGKFGLYIQYPESYPFAPMEIQFISKIYHLNISENGKLCMQMLDKDGWSPAWTLRHTLLSLISLMTKPDIQYAIKGNESILEQYQTNQSLYNKTAKEWTMKYAQNPKLPIFEVPQQVFENSIDTKLDTIKSIQPYERCLISGFIKNVLQSMNSIATEIEDIIILFHYEETKDCFENGHAVSVDKNGMRVRIMSHEEDGEYGYGNGSLLIDAAVYKIYFWIFEIKYSHPQIGIDYDKSDKSSDFLYHYAPDYGTVMMMKLDFSGDDGTGVLTFGEKMKYNEEWDNDISGSTFGVNSRFTVSNIDPLKQYRVKVSMWGDLYDNITDVGYCSEGGTVEMLYFSVRCLNESC